MCFFVPVVNQLFSDKEMRLEVHLSIFIKCSNPEEKIKMKSANMDNPIF